MSNSDYDDSDYDHAIVTITLEYRVLVRRDYDDLIRKPKEEIAGIAWDEILASRAEYGPEEATEAVLVDVERAR